MFNLSRNALLVFLGGYLCLAAAAGGKVSQASASSTPSAQVLGQIVRSSAASLGGVTVPSGGTLLSGDTLSTSAGGGALVKFSAGSQVELEQNTSVSFSGTPTQVVAKVTQGTVVAQASDQNSLVIETSSCTMRPAGPSGGIISVNASPGPSATITARRGGVSMMEKASGKVSLLAEGSTSGCPNISAGTGPEEGKPAPGERAGQAPPAAGPAAGAAAGGSHTGLLLVVLGVGGAVGVGVALAGGHGGGGGGPASPSSP
ncbi:MAG TPA: FecR domain-containing protein [Terriglobia bacterium]